MTGTLHCMSVVAPQVFVGSIEKQICIEMKFRDWCDSAKVDHEFHPPWLQGIGNTRSSECFHHCCSSSLAFLLWLWTMVKISSIHGKHWSGLDPLNLFIFSNALFILFLLLLSALNFFSLFSLHLSCSLWASSLSWYNLNCLSKTCVINSLVSVIFEWTDGGCCSHCPG